MEAWSSAEQPLTRNPLTDARESVGRAAADPIGIDASVLPLVSVVVPVLNEEERIAACLRSVVEQTYPHERMEVIVADGGSADRTREIVARLMAEFPFIRLIDNPQRIQAAGLNAAIRISRGEVIARLDGHAAWAPDHLLRCVALLESTGADNVGGTMAAVGSTPTGEAIARATRSPLAVGGAKYRYALRQQDVDTVWLGCFRRDSLERSGLYDESLEVHEDYELNHRIRAVGGRILFSPDLPVRYWTRGSWSALARQYYRYGRGKAVVSIRDPGVLRPYHLIPPVAVAMTPLAGLVAIARPGFRLPLAVVGSTYLAACLAVAMHAGRSAPFSVRWRIPLVFPVVHMAWGAGFLSTLPKVANSWLN
jgi:cellulose synthase/poly-beta-1,6-N-acetylglucosamine synthase-like glycosyltransferase